MSSGGRKYKPTFAPIGSSREPQASFAKAAVGSRQNFYF